jgi:hypothetical protein
MTTVLDILPRPVLRWALRWVRTAQHAWRRPAMVERVLFVNYATYLGRPRDALSTYDGPVWMAVSMVGPDYFRLDTCGTRAEVLTRVVEICAGSTPPVVLIDRSLLRGFGASHPSHPAHHSSFSIWIRMTDEERSRISDAEVIEREVHIHRDAYV